MTLGELVSTLKDGAFLVGILLAGWKARGLVQPMIDFFRRALSFMDSTETKLGRLDSGMNMLLTNHLSHLAQGEIHPVIPEVDPLLEK
jgi:hypothetical protein